MLQFRMGLPMDRETERGRECRCGLTGDAYGHHSVQCKHGPERKKRHNQPTRILSLMAKRIGCGAHVEQQVYGRVQKPPKGVKNTYTADIVIDDCYGIGQQLVGDVTFAHPNNPSVYVARSEQRRRRWLSSRWRWRRTALSPKSSPACSTGLWASGARCTRRRPRRWRYIATR